MMDKQTIMSWLEGLAQDDWRECHSDSEVQEIARQTLAMLKEQEPVEPIYGSHGKRHCGNCRNLLWVIGQRFCASCGRAVKWND